MELAAPRPDEAVRREAERQRRDEEMQLAHVQDYAMDGTEREGADLAKRQPAPAGGAVGSRADTAGGSVRRDPRCQRRRAPGPDGKAGSLALEILAVAEHASKAAVGTPRRPGQRLSPRWPGMCRTAPTA